MNVIKAFRTFNIHLSLAQRFISVGARRHGGLTRSDRLKQEEETGDH